MTAAPLGHKACKTSRHKPILLVFFPKHRHHRLRNVPKHFEQRLDSG